MIMMTTSVFPGIATDGASVMVGKKAGVVKRLKDQTNRAFIQGIHCSAHRLKLSFKDATKDLSLWTKASNLLLGVYLFYRNSPLNRSNLLQAFAMEGTPLSLLFPLLLKSATILYFK